MPPFVARKRRLSTPPEDTPPPKKLSTRSATLRNGKTPTPSQSSGKKSKYFDPSSEESSSSLSDVSSSDFEDISPPNKRPQLVEDDEESDWENVLEENGLQDLTTGPEATGDLELTLTKNDEGHLLDADGQKKGPSKIERRIRIATHCMHVQFLMFHNAVRNAWICDSEVQKILVDQLTPQMKELVKTWRRDTGIPARDDKPSAVGKGKGKTPRKGARSRREGDWGPSAQRQEPGVPNLSQGDPVVKLLRPLAAYWRKRFNVTSPGLRKRGYKSIKLLEEDIASFKDKHDPEEHGERIANLKEFKEHARRTEGSRDVGAQLFTALVRGLGIEARLVTSLQPIGFGWNKNEEAVKRKKSTKEDSVQVEALSEEEDSSDNSILDADDSIIDITISLPKRNLNQRHDDDLACPNYWTEVVSPTHHRVYPVDSIVMKPAIYTKQEEFMAFEPRGAKADRAKQVFAYVIAHSADGTAKEVTTRYLKRQMWPGRTKGVRLPVEKVPIHNKHGKIKRYEQYDWFKTVMSAYRRPHNLRTLADDIEDSRDLKPAKIEAKKMKESEETLQGYKQSAEFVLERHLRREEAIPPNAKSVKTFTAGKGDKARAEPVYLRKHVVICKTPEAWRREGRNIVSGQDPMKHVSIRAVTTNRKLEIMEEERETGIKKQQPMYSKAQTEYIIPPPISNGEIPKNAYGSMDVFVPSMVPEGAVHVPLNGTVRLCKKLGIDYAEAVTGFEFGSRRAVPVIDGVVVAVENEDAVIDAWEADQEQKQMKADEKRQKAALTMWRKFLMGLRIVERVRDEYGEDLDGFEKEDVNPFTNKNKQKQAEDAPVEAVSDDDDGQDAAGGFIIEDEDI